MPHKIGDSEKRRRHFIREWRVFRGLTQEYLAEQIGATKASISRIENFKQSYTQEILEACAEVLGTHPGVLLMRPPGNADFDPPPPPRISPSSKTRAHSRRSRISLS
ncbi:MAG: helix-turn-helix domain-containing protein [Rhizomicrobium sp.]